jgi:anti-sigma regulatory factor (Ser/Thr protein kinase)
MSTTIGTARGPDEGFRHQAYFYDGLDEFVPGMASFIRDALVADEPILVVVSAEKIDLLTAELGGDAGDVCFADMAQVGANPARIIPAWHDFVSERSAPGRRIRGIGEPIGPHRDPDELAECHRHESLLNLAFADHPDFWLMCPYDTAALAPEVVAHAHHTHPLVLADGTPSESASFPGLDAVRAPFDEPLPEPPADAAELEVWLESLSTIRRFVSGFAAATDLGDRAADLLMAVNEIATNSVRHGGGRGMLRLWHEPGKVVCEVRDHGRIAHPLAGRERPVSGQIGGYGLWLANQVCDLVQLRAFPDGGAVRLHIRVDPSS